MLHLFLLLKSPFRAITAWLVSLKAHNTSELDRVLAPFANVHAKLAAVEANAKTAETALRAEIAALLTKAEAQAASGAQAATAAAKIGDLLGK